jgi:hypothetical protein
LLWLFWKWGSCELFVWAVLGSQSSRSQPPNPARIIGVSHWCLVSPWFLRQGLNIYSRLALNSQSSLCHLSAGITGMYHYTHHNTYFKCFLVF